MPLTRARADKMVAALSARAQEINDDPRYLHWIKRVAIFGSFLTDKDPLGDLDTAIDFQPRFLPFSGPRWERFFTDFPPPLSIARLFHERLFWPELKLKRDFAVGRLQRVHDYSELERLGCAYRDISLPMWEKMWEQSRKYRLLRIEAG